jgi:hypothetical protein
MFDAQIYAMSLVGIAMVRVVGVNQRVGIELT